MFICYLYKPKARLFRTQTLVTRRVGLDEFHCILILAEVIILHIIIIFIQEIYMFYFNSPFLLWSVLVMVRFGYGMKHPLAGSILYLVSCDRNLIALFYGHHQPEVRNLSSINQLDFSKTRCENTIICKHDIF